MRFGLILWGLLTEGSTASVAVPKQGPRKFRLSQPRIAPTGAVWRGARGAFPRGPRAAEGRILRDAVSGG